MPISLSPFAFEDCRELFSRALETDKGLEVAFKTVGEAIRFRHRMNTFRAQDRKRNEKLYPEGELMHKSSTYDQLIVSIPKENGQMLPIIRIIKRTALDLEVREL